jgi:hypothetical protein
MHTAKVVEQNLKLVVLVMLYIDQSRDYFLK